MGLLRSILPKASDRPKNRAGNPKVPSQVQLAPQIHAARILHNSGMELTVLSYFMARLFYSCCVLPADALRRGTIPDA